MAKKIKGTLGDVVYRYEQNKIQLKSVKENIKRFEEYEEKMIDAEYNFQQAIIALVRVYFPDNAIDNTNFDIETIKKLMTEDTNDQEN